MRRIAFDFHGVIEKYPELFKPIMVVMKYAGNEIWIVSGPPRNDIGKKLKDAGYISGIHYDKVVSVVDYLKQNYAKTWQDGKGDWWAEDSDWWGSKARICEEYEIGVMIDDSVGYAKYFEGKHTKFVLFGKKKGE